MEWKDFEAVLRDVWVGEYPKWRAKHLKVDRLCDISKDFGSSITSGEVVFGAPTGAHIILSSVEKSFGGYDTLNRNICRIGHDEPYFRLGRPWEYGIRYEDNQTVTDGETLRAHSVTYDKMMLATTPYNLLAYSELRFGDSSTYETCEVDALGLDIWCVVGQPVENIDDILDEQSGIKWQYAYYDSETGYSYDDEYVKKLVLEADGLNLWGHSAATAYRVGDLDNLKTMARYGPTGFLLNGYQYENDSVHFFFESTAGQCRASMFFYREGYDSLLMEWEDTGWTVTHADKDVFHIDEDGVTIRDYLAWHIDSAEPSSPPTGALVYDRAEDYYKFYNSAGEWRRLSDEAIP